MAGGGEYNGNTSAGINDILTDEILIEILHRIPCKSALQCKVVCKRWCSLIPSPYFLRRYHARQLADGHCQNEYTINCYRKHLFLIPLPDPGFQISLDFLPLFDGGEESDQFRNIVLASCNGLLLCSADQRMTDHGIYYICNPITKQWVALPPAPRSHQSVDIGFVCDSYCQVDDKGSAMINTNCKYKIVRIPYIKILKSEFEVEIFSSETGQWTDSVMSSPKPFFWQVQPSPAILYNGLLHWLIAHNEILVYDIHNNRVPFLIDPPEGSPYPKFQVQGLGVCCGKLTVSVIYWKYLAIWEFGHGQATTKPKWSMRCQINLFETIIHEDRKLLNNSVHAAKVLAIHPDDPNILYFGIRNDIVLLCNLRTKTLKLVAHCSNRDQDHCYHDWFKTFTVIHSWWPWPTPIPAISSICRAALPIMVTISNELSISIYI